MSKVPSGGEGTAGRWWRGDGLRSEIRASPQLAG